MNPVGQRLREARLARGLTQQQLAMGLATKGFISQVERDRATPSLAKLRLLAERLSLPLAALTGDQTPLDLTYLKKGAVLALNAREPERALRLVEEAAPLATTANERAELLRLKGRAFDDSGRLEDALRAHQEAAATAPPDDPELNALIYAEIGNVLNQQEQFNAAVEAGLRALNWLDRLRTTDPALRARVLTNLGRSNYGLGQIHRSHAFFQEALAAATDAESLYRIANAHMALGVSARATGDLQAAVEHSNRALEIWRRIDDERVANRVLNNLGDALWSMGRKAEAKVTQQRCLERARELHDDFEVGVAGGELARYLLEEGDLGRVIKLARESQKAAAASRDHLHEAYAHAVEASAAEKLGHHRQADRKFRYAIGLLLERQAAGKLAEISAMYADALRRRGRHDVAFALLRLAAERDFGRLPSLLKLRR
ncbi:MAG TPA: tetratricopeptide repeat protein [Candidatus Dormibacteraeota bacterium]